MNLYYSTLEEATIVNQRVTAACLAAGIWSNGTNNYCNPYQEEETGQWVIPILEGYQQFFTSFELSIANQNMQPEVREVLQDKWFCKQIHVKLLAAFKTMPTLNQGTYRQMSDIFWYAKDAAEMEILLI